jgi:hypothetical protein
MVQQIAAKNISWEMSRTAGELRLTDERTNHGGVRTRLALAAGRLEEE